MKISWMIFVVFLLLIAGCSQKDDGWKESAVDTSSWLGEGNQTNTGGAEMPKQVHAEHILVKTNEEANSILFDLNRGGNFEDIARARSLCPSGKKGGDLGWFGRGMMVKEFEDAAFATPPGKISGIVKTQFGYHLIKVLEIK